ncbi:hypothetical protein [Halopiger djelfimassiliensis]|nr:hypothetical protein [Halopiger djelfimassiliensis]
MAISQSPADDESDLEYTCPECSGTLGYESFACADCGFTPAHGAD